VSRRARIHRGLRWAEEQGLIRSWYAGSGDHGTRWVVEGVAFTERVWSTSQVEAFLTGLDCIEVAINGMNRARS